MDGCSACIRAGDPRGTLQASLSSMNCMFNGKVAVDILHYGYRSADRAIFHDICLGASYFEMPLINSRSLEDILAVLGLVWARKHGEPSKLKCDQEFRNGLEARNIKFEPAPARRRRKNGKIKKIKDILDRIALHQRSLQKPKSLGWIASQACFLSNALIGNRACSAFEMARKLTPSILGAGSAPLPNCLKEAEIDMRARSLWSRLKRSKGVSAGACSLPIGDPALVLIPGGPRKRGFGKMRRSNHTVNQADALKMP